MRATRWFTVLLVCFFLGVGVSPAYAASIIVDTLVDGQGVPGCSLREAIANANNDNSAQGGCSAGLGADTILLNVTGSYTLTAGTSLEISSTITIQEASGVIALISGNRTARQFTIGGNGNLTLKGLELRHGHASTAGGCIQVGSSNGGSVTVDDGILQECSTTSSSGGAIGSVGHVHSITVINSLLQNNSAGENGGAISESGMDSHLSIVGSSFLGNVAGSFANAPVHGQGGAIHFAGDSATSSFSITNSIFTNNSVHSVNNSSVGGALTLSFTDMTGTISGSTFADNHAQDGAVVNRGGAIYKTGTGTLDITGSVFTGNSVLGGANAQGGAVYNNQGNLSIIASRIQNNIAGTGGAAYYSVSSGYDVVMNSCIVNNGDTAMIDTEATFFLNATANWWGSSYGPQIAALASTTGSYVSNGDSISGDGHVLVNVGLINAGSTNPGLDGVPPTGDWLTELPTVAGATCNVCTEPSSTGRARFCS